MPKATTKKPKKVNPFKADVNYMGEITVAQLVEMVSDRKEFPKGLDTRICIADVEGNLGVNHDIMLVAHKPGDVLLAVDMHGGDMDYDADEED
jgi:hypothetical protein